MKHTAERFWPKVNKQDGDSCWVWMGTKDGGGYGLLTSQKKTRRAHRVSWMLNYGDIPLGMDVCHRCDNPSCVRPDHLFLGTHNDNMRDASCKGRFPRGESSWRSRLTRDQVIYARTVLKNRKHGDIRRIAIQLNVEPETISCVIKRKTWRHIP